MTNANVETETEKFDTDKVGEVVRRIKLMFQEEARRLKEEKEMERALLMDDVRSAVKETLRDERASFMKRVKDAVTFFFSQEPKK